MELIGGPLDGETIDENMLEPRIAFQIDENRYACYEQLTGDKYRFLSIHTKDWFDPASFPE